MIFTFGSVDNNSIVVSRMSLKGFFAINIRMYVPVYVVKGSFPNVLNYNSICGYIAFIPESFPTILMVRDIM